MIIFSFIIYKLCIAGDDDIYVIELSKPNHQAGKHWHSMEDEPEPKANTFNRTPMPNV